MVAKTERRKANRSPRRTPAVIRKQAEAVKLKVAGATYEDIARVLGYQSKSGAYDAVRAGLAESLRDAGTDELRQLEAERLERLHLSRWKRAMDGDDDAYTLVLQTAKQRAALLGLNAPVKLQHAGDPDNPIQIEAEINLKGLSDDELRHLIALGSKVAADAIPPG